MNLKGYTIEKTFSLFPTCVIDFDLSQHSDINILLEIINETKNLCQPHGLLEDSISSFGIIPILEDPRLVNLKNTIQMCIFDYAAIAGLEKIYITNNWYNIMSVGSRVTAHRHYGSTVSGAFYPLMDLNSSNLFFNSPIAPYKMNDITPESNLDNPFSTVESEINIKQGHLYIFPSWLEHGVNINKTSNRIVVSFNTDRKK
jgi:hypothetical protein